jgi:hypothetical protein
VTSQWVNAGISAIGVVTAVGSSLAIVSYRIGRNDQRITDLEKNKAELADVTSMKESLAEIKGMFVLRLRE